MATSETDGTVVAGLMQQVMAHTGTWGKVWFGLIFWGSVLFAAATRLWPDGPQSIQLAVSLAIGLAGGLLARRRGYWL